MQYCNAYINNTAFVHMNAIINASLQFANILYYVRTYMYTHP